MGKLLSAACKEQWSHKTILFVELLYKEPEEGSLPSDQCVIEISKGEGLFLCEDFCFNPIETATHNSLESWTLVFSYPDSRHQLKQALPSWTLNFQILLLSNSPIQWERRTKTSLSSQRQQTLSNSKLSHLQPLQETVAVLKPGQPAEQSGSKAKQAGEDTPDPGTCSSPWSSVSVKLKAQRKTKPAAYYMYTLALPCTFNPKPVMFSPICFNTVKKTQIALCSGSTMASSQAPEVFSSWHPAGDCALGPSHRNTVIHEYFGMFVSLWSKPLRLQSYNSCISMKGVDRFHRLHIYLAKRREAKAFST